MINKNIDLSAPIHDLLGRRWSGVAYDPERPVSDATLRSLAEAARWAPSCFGDQPWHILFCNRDSDRQAWEQALACLGEKNQAWCRFAPVLALTCVDTLFKHNDSPNAWAEYDSGAAAMSICIQAVSLDLMTHQMAGFSADKARATFGIPERYTPKAMMAIGYQVAENRIPEEFRERELKPRARNPLDRQLFLNGWGKGF